MKYDVVIIGAGPGGIFSAYELMKLKPELKVVVLEAGQPLEKRKCPIEAESISGKEGLYMYVNLTPRFVKFTIEICVTFFNLIVSVSLLKVNQYGANN